MLYKLTRPAPYVVHKNIWKKIYKKKKKKILRHLTLQSCPFNCLQVATWSIPTSHKPTRLVMPVVGLMTMRLLCLKSTWNFQTEVRIEIKWFNTEEKLSFRAGYLLSKPVFILPCKNVFMQSLWAITHFILSNPTQRFPCFLFSSFLFPCFYV